MCSLNVLEHKYVIIIKLSYLTHEACHVKLNEVKLLAKLISKAVQKIHDVCYRMYVCLYPNLWYRSVAEPDIVESCSLRHFCRYSRVPEVLYFRF